MLQDRPTNEISEFIITTIVFYQSAHLLMISSVLMLCT